MNTAAKTIFITGAAAGIGRATAQLFASHGWRVGLYDLNAAELAKTQAELGEQCFSQVLDVCDEASVTAAVEHFARHSNAHMDVLFNSAGLLTTGAFTDNPAGTAEKLFNVNVLGLERVTRRAFPLLATTAGARVINMSSYSALYGVPDFALYSASKFAVRGLTEALNLEWQQHDIHVCDLMPPFVDTGMVSNAKRVTSIKKLGVKLSAKDVANVVWQASRKNQLHWHVGTANAAQAAVLARLPAAAQRAFIKNLSGY